MKSRFSSLLLVLLAIGLLALAVAWGRHSAREGSTSGTLTSEAPPGVRFVSVALGGFRGLLADYLWVRASSLQQEGRFFEVAQLSDWITRLEPRSPEVWAYHAWNMSYNITAMLSDPGDRWHWVKNGIRLLRDEGIPSNPSSPKLYWELGWLFYDKVGGRWDEATPYYRISWARDMSQLLGSGQVDYPALAQQGGTTQLMASVGLNLEAMKAADSEYGPLDWRLPETHSLYWGFRGQHLLPVSDAVWCERLIWMALKETLKGGALTFMPEQHRYQRGPRLDIAIKVIHQCADKKPARDPLVSMAKFIFLKESAVYLYAFQQPVEADAALRLLQKEKASDVPVGLTLETFVQKELADQMRGLDDLSREKRVVNHLVQGDIWRRLEVPPYAEGYVHLAKLCWTVATGTNGTDKAWQTLQNEAREKSLREMPPLEAIR